MMYSLTQYTGTYLCIWCTYIYIYYICIYYMSYFVYFNTVGTSRGLLPHPPAGRQLPRFLPTISTGASLEPTLSKQNSCVFSLNFNELMLMAADFSSHFLVLSICEFVFLFCSIVLFCCEACSSWILVLQVTAAASGLGYMISTTFPPKHGPFITVTALEIATACSDQDECQI